jgi:hypothetical protein
MPGRRKIRELWPSIAPERKVILYMINIFNKETSFLEESK